MRPSCFRPTYLSFSTRTTLLASCLTVATLVVATQVDGAVIASCGFESAGDTWPFTAANGARSTDPGASDYPSGQRILTGSASWQVTGKTTSILTFSDLLLSGWIDASISYRVSSTASGTNGHIDDRVETYVAEKLADLPGSAAAIRLKNNKRAAWGYNSSASQQVTTAGSGATLELTAAGSGLRESDGYSNFKIMIPNDQSTVALRLSAKNSAANTYWNLDDVALDGTPTTSHNCLWTAGSDTWDHSTDTKRWTDQTNGNSPSTWNAANGDNAYFSQAGDTITIAPDTMVAARSLTFSADGCTIAAGNSSTITASRLALTAGGSGGAGANTIEVTDPNHTATIDAPIIGNPGVGLNKKGAGTLVLKGKNTYSGATLVSDGTLVLDTDCSVLSTLIDVQNGATLDLSALGPYTFRDDTTLKGAGTIIGNLVIAGSHDVGNSPGVQCIQGNYAMNGTLLIEVDGSAAGNGAAFYDQVRVTDGGLGSAAYDVSLSGALSLAWDETSPPVTDNKLWIIRNDTAGTLAGAFNNYSNGSPVGNYHDCSWNIYYGADAETGRLTGGNDVLLAAQSVPEPSSLWLVISSIVAWLAWHGSTVFVRSTGFKAVSRSL